MLLLNLALAAPSNGDVTTHGATSAPFLKGDVEGPKALPTGGDVHIGTKTMFQDVRWRSGQMTPEGMDAVAAAQPEAMKNLSSITVDGHTGWRVELYEGERLAGVQSTWNCDGVYVTLVTAGAPGTTPAVIHDATVAGATCVDVEIRKQKVATFSGGEGWTAGNDEGNQYMHSDGPFAMAVSMTTATAIGMTDEFGCEQVLRTSLVEPLAQAWHFEVASLTLAETGCSATWAMTTPDGELPGVVGLLPCGDTTVGGVVAGENTQLWSCP